MNAFEDISTLFKSMSGLYKRKYPKLKDYVKYIDRISGDETAIAREVDAFRTFFAKNYDFETTRDLREWTYRGGRGDSIYFKNVPEFAKSEDEVLLFWTRLSAVFRKLYPDGVVEKPIPNEDRAIEMLGGADTPMGALVKRLRGNIVVEDLLGNVDTLIALGTRLSDSIGGAKNGDVDIQTILMFDEMRALKDVVTNGCSSGRYKVKDILELIECAMTLPHVESDERFATAFRVVKRLLNAAEKGASPDPDSLRELLNVCEDYVDSVSDDPTVAGVFAQIKEVVGLLKDGLSKSGGNRCCVLDVNRLMSFVGDMLN